MKFNGAVIVTTGGYYEYLKIQAVIIQIGTLKVNIPNSTLSGVLMRAI